jgi:preprotein translocase subunit SecG
LSILANVLLVINVFVCIALIALVLVQRSEGGALGMGGGGGPSGFLTTRGAGDLLTRMTWILAFIFFALAMAQTLLIGRAHGHSSIIDRLNAQSLDFSTPAKPQTQPVAPATAPGLQAPLPTVQSPPAVIPGLPQNGTAQHQPDLSALAGPPLLQQQPAQKKP